MERHRKTCIAFRTTSRILQSGNIAYFGPHIQHVQRIRQQYPQTHILQFDYFSKYYKYDNLTVRADIQDIPLQNNSMDGAIVLHILEHVPNLYRAQRELARIIKPRGILIHETPCTRGTLTYCPNSTTKTGVCAQEDHIWSYSCSYLKDKFKKTDLSAIRIHQASSVIDSAFRIRRLANTYHCCVIVCDLQPRDEDARRSQDTTVGGISLPWAMQVMTPRRIHRGTNVTQGGRRTAGAQILCPEFGRIVFFSRRYTKCLEFWHRRSAQFRFSLYLRTNLTVIPFLTT